MEYEEIGYKVAVGFLPFLFAISFHEFAHAWVAKMRGDRTAELMGRLTLNPVSHMDPIGTLLLPLMSIVGGFPGFGWAKPVPVMERNLKNPKTDMFWVAIAGPLSNIFLAIVGSLVYAVFLFTVPETALAARDFFFYFIIINMVLALFNAIPLHPLDGGKIMARFLPGRWNDWLESNQFYLSMILFALFFTGGLRFISIPALGSAQFLMGLAEGVLR